MKKSWIIILVIAIVIIGIIVGFAMFNNKENFENNLIVNEINEVSEKVTDECTIEYEKLL